MIESPLSFNIPASHRAGATQLVFADPGDGPVTPTSPRSGDELRMSTGPASESQYLPRHAQGGVTQCGLDQRAVCECRRTVWIRTLDVNRTQFERSRIPPIKAPWTFEREVTRHAVSKNATFLQRFRLWTAAYEGKSRGEGGIRTLGTLLGYGALAKRCFRPLSHLTSGVREYGRNYRLPIANCQRN